VTFSWNASYGILDYGRVCLTPAEVTEGDSPIYQSILAVATDINDLVPIYRIGRLGGELKKTCTCS